MKAISKGHIRLARSRMRANRWRSLFTMLGVIVGVMAVVLVVGIGVGIKRQVSDQINRYSKNVITVRPANLGASGTGNPLAALSGYSIPGVLSARDTNQVAKAKGVIASVPLIAVAGNASGDQTYGGGLVIGTTAALPQVVNQPLAYGSFFTSDDANSNVAVLGATAAEKLFDEDVPLGRSFTFRGQQFMVRGVLNSFPDTPFSTDTNFNNAIFIPAPVANQLTNNAAPLYEILAKVSTSGQLPAAAHSIRHELLQTHGQQTDFSVLQPSQAQQTATGLLTLLTELIVGASAIALLVGGIGIMNVMLVSVSERLHEIGIRKAVGATNRQILSQFLAESLTLSVTGCIIGVVWSLLVDVILRLTTNLTPVIGWQIILASLIGSVGLGGLFGSIPALRAARKEPIAALRNE